MKLIHFIVLFSLVVLIYYFYNTQIFEGYANYSKVNCSIGKEYTNGRDMILAVSYGPRITYNVRKDQVNDVMDRIQREYPYAKLCNRSDIQGLVNKNKPYCFCGWVKAPMDTNSVYFGDYITLNNKYLSNAYLSIVGNENQGYKLQTFNSPTYRFGGGIFHITSAVGKKGQVENNDLVYLENKGNQGNGQGGYLSVRTDLPGNCVTSRDFQASTQFTKNTRSIWKIRIPHNDNKGIKIKKNDYVIFISMDQDSRKIKEMPYMLATCNWVRWPVELGISVRRQSGVGGGGSDVQWQIKGFSNEYIGNENQVKVGWCGNNEHDDSSNFIKSSTYPDCKTECLNNSECQNIRWVKSSKRCDLLKDCEINNNDNRWGHMKLGNEENTMANYQSVYPSTRSTGRGCGSGAQRIINCGNISWAGGRSGVYVKLVGIESEVIKKLRDQGLDARIVWKSNQCNPKVYNNNFRVKVLNTRAIWFLGRRGVNDYNIRGIDMETAVEMANEKVYAIEYDPYNKNAIFRTYNNNGKCPPIKIGKANSWNLHLIPKRWNGKGEVKSNKDISFIPHIGNRIKTNGGLNDIIVSGISLKDAQTLVRNNTYAIVYNKKKSEATLLSFNKEGKPPNNIDISEENDFSVYAIEGRYHMKEPIIDPFRYQQDKRLSTYISPIKPERNMDMTISYSKPLKFQDRKCDMSTKKNCFNKSDYIDNNLGIWRKDGKDSWYFLGKEKDANVLNNEYNSIVN